MLGRMRGGVELYGEIRQVGARGFVVKRLGGNTCESNQISIEHDEGLDHGELVDDCHCFCGELGILS